MKDRLYFTCDWMIDFEGIKHLGLLYDTAFDLACVLWRQGIITDSNILMSRFYIQVPSKETLDKLIEEAGRLMGLTEWQAIDDRDLEFVPLFVVPFRDLSGNVQSSMMEGFHISAEHN